MGTIWVKEFIGGLDTRRMPETTSGGVLIKGENGHISRGGEFEKRAAFVPEFGLPDGTVGLAATRTGIYVFGSGPAPTMPLGVTYQRLEHEDVGTVLTRVLSWDLYAGKIYAVGEFADGSIVHFYDGTRVEDWFDGRASASFRVTAGSVTPAVSASGGFEITGGTVGGPNVISAVTIDGVALIGAPVAHTGDDATTAAALAAAITSHVSSPNYSATASGQLVTVTADTPGPLPNGKAVAVTVGGDVTVGNEQFMDGGADEVMSRLTNLRVAGLQIIAGPVDWAGTPEDMAAAIAAAVNSYISSPGYRATSVEETVNIIANDAGVEANGRVVIASVANGLGISPLNSTMTGGADSEDAFQPGTFVKTIGQKMYSVAGPNTHFSGISEPTRWTTDVIGAGFIDMSIEASGSEELLALAKYQNFAAVFAERVIQIWFFDPDPSLNRQIQVLNNTGTVSANSVTQFGDDDLFYLDESGLRSLRARDSSNAAATTDIGVPVDTLITAHIATMTDRQREDIIGLIEPRDGRFWLIVHDTIYVFSFFNGAKVSAWTTYKVSHIVDDDTVALNVSAAVVHNKRVYLRSGDTVFVYGGLGTTPQYDETVADAWLPYLDASAPARKKDWEGIDAALEGLWEVRFAMEPTLPSAEDLIATLFRTTYNVGSISASGSSSHISVRFRTKGPGPAKLSSVVIHYEGKIDED